MISPLDTKHRPMFFWTINFLVSVVAPCINNIKCNMAAAGWLWIILPVEGESLALLSLRIHSAHKAPDPQRGFSVWDKKKRGMVFCTSWYNCWIYGWISRTVVCYKEMKVSWESEWIPVSVISPFSPIVVWEALKRVSAAGRMPRKLTSLMSSCTPLRLPWGPEDSLL